MLRGVPEMKPSLLIPRLLRTSALGASFAAAALAAPAFAQDTAAEPTDTAAPQANPYDDSGIIIVTAQGRAQALSDVPVAIRSEEHTSELQSLMRISYAVFCLQKKKNKEHS